MNYLFMKPKTRYIIAGMLSCVLLICIGVVMHYRLPYTLSMPTLPTLSLVQQVDSFKQKLELTNQLHEQALERIKKELQIPDQQWNTFVAQLQSLKHNDDLFSYAAEYQTDHPFKQMVTRLATEYGMNSDVINISFVKKDRKIDIQTRQPIIDGMLMHILEVDLDWIQKYPLLTQEAFVRHELMHLYNYDSTQNNLLYQLLEDLGHQDFMNNPAVAHFNHQMELRADLLACCKSSEITYALKYDFDRDLSSLVSEWASNTHPSPHIRVAQLEQLLQEMQTTAPKQA